MLSNNSFSSLNRDLKKNVCAVDFLNVYAKIITYNQRLDVFLYIGLGILQAEVGRVIHNLLFTLCVHVRVSVVP